MCHLYKFEDDINIPDDLKPGIKKIVRRMVDNKHEILFFRAKFEGNLLIRKIIDYRDRIVVEDMATYIHIMISVNSRLPENNHNKTLMRIAKVLDHNTWAYGDVIPHNYNKQTCPYFNIFDRNLDFEIKTRVSYNGIT